MLDVRRLIMLKTAALLHDPPHKAWIVLGKYRVLGRDGKAHEREAERLAKELLDGTVLKEAFSYLKGDEVKEADKLAASIDRALHAAVEEGAPWGALHVANMFDPVKKFPGENPRLVPDAGRVGEFVRELREVIQEISRKGDAITAYHALYALMEPVWFNKVGLVGPADTRIPNHTIFDHLYAVASAVNIMSSGSVGGYIVLLDIAGIQYFVSKARKTVDYWAGSWLVSALSWYLVRDAVELLGPDCLVMPTARLNPFYVTWLLGRARKRKYSNLENALKKYLGPVAGRGWPRHPIMPGTAVLVLPEGALRLLSGSAVHAGEDEAEALRKYFIERFADGWRRVVDSVISSAREGGSLPPGEADRLEKALSAVRDVPPLPIRVKVLRLADLFKELLGEGRNRQDVKLDREEARALLYHHAVSELFRKGPSDSIAIGVGALNDWSSMSDGRYTLCSMCGRLPSVVRYGKDPSTNDWWFLKEGESLCPYCLVKRSLRRRVVLNRVVEEVVGEGVRVVEDVFFPSTCELAGVGTKLEFLRRLLRLRDPGVAEKALNVLQDLLVKAGRPSLEGVPEVLRRKLNELLDNYGYGDPRSLLGSALLMTDAEELLHSSDNAIKRLKYKKIKELGEGLSVPHYYVVLKADGDDIGEVLSGRKWFVRVDGGGRAEALRKYYEEVLGSEVAGSGMVREFIKKSARRLDDLLSRYEKLTGSRSPGRKQIFMPLSMASHSCISRALMATALLDSRAVERYGTVVYAGGDDLMALVPAVIAAGRPTLPFLEVINETRRSFWGGHSGFITLGGVSPALRGAGRTYSAFLTHCKDPLGVSIEVAAALMGAGKDVRLLKVTAGEGAAGECVRKDASVIGYGRGGFEHVALPNRLCGEGVGEAVELLTYLHDRVKAGHLSENVFRDVSGVTGLLAGLLRAGLVDHARKLLEHVIRRNVRNEGTASKIAGKLLDARVADLVVSGGVREWLPHALLRALNIVLRGER